jgi:hypothetical protein
VSKAAISVSLKAPEFFHLAAFSRAQGSHATFAKNDQKKFASRKFAKFLTHSQCFWQHRRLGSIAQIAVRFCTKASSFHTPATIKGSLDESTIPFHLKRGLT